MERQRNSTQVTEQTRNTEVQINEEEIGKSPEKEFRIMIVKMIKTLENKMEKIQESRNKDIDELKNKHTETNNTITEIKNTLLLLLLSRFSRVQLCATPHRPQPTRLCRHWDSPGKNTGVGCHFLLQCKKVKSESEVAQLCPTLCDPMDCSLPGSSLHGIL